MDDNSILSDNDLIDKIRTLDPELFREVVLRYQSKLFRYIMTLVQDEDITLDIVQSTFIKVYINLNGFNSTTKFSSWIYRIAHNEAINAKKRWRREVSIDDYDGEIGDEDSLIDLQIDNEEANMIRDCVNQLPVEYSSVIALYYFEEKSYEEISDVLLIPTSTVGTRIRRGRIILKKSCKQIKQ